MVNTEYLKSLVDSETLLLSLGFHIYRETQDEIRAPCAIHGGDNRTAFLFKKQSKRFYCFTHKCELNEFGSVDNDVVSLIMKVNRCSFHEAISFLCLLTGIDISEVSDIDIDVAVARKQREKETFIKSVLKTEAAELSEDMVLRFRNNGAAYFKGLGFSQEIVDKFELGTMVDIDGIERGTIPIRDVNSRLIGLSGRRTDGGGEPRYRLLKNFQKRKTLYNIYNAIKLRDAYDGSVFIVEGFKALWWSFLCGYKNIVAVMGASIAPEQVNLLVSCGFRRALLMLDGDSAGVAGMRASEDLLRGKLETVSVCLPEGKSPDDLDCADLNGLIDIFLND